MCEVTLQVGYKYMGMFLFDKGNDDGGMAYEENRKIVSAERVNRQGNQMVTVLVGSEGDTDKNQGYMVNSTLNPLIKAGSNEGWIIRAHERFLRWSLRLNR